jgi:hypothetical protein
MKSHWYLAYLFSAERTSPLSSTLLLCIGEKENLLILKVENMKRLKALLGDRPIFFGSSRKRFLGAIMKRSADLAMALSSDAAPDMTNKDSGPPVPTPAAPSRAPTVEELDWATAGTTAAAVIGATTLILAPPVPCYDFCTPWLASSMSSISHKPLTLVLFFTLSTGGAEIIRVHNVRLTRAVCDVARAIANQ